MKKIFKGMLLLAFFGLGMSTTRLYYTLYPKTSPAYNAGIEAATDALILSELPPLGKLLCLANIAKGLK